MNKYIEFGGNIIPTAEVHSVRKQPMISDKEVMHLVVYTGPKGDSAHSAEYTDKNEATVVYNNIRLALQNSGNEINNCN